MGRSPLSYARPMHRRRSHLAYRFLLASMLAAAACGEAKRDAAPGPGTGEAVASIGGTTVGAAEIAAEMRRSGKTAREALDAVVDFELCAAAAAQVVAPG